MQVTSGSFVGVVPPVAFGTDGYPKQLLLMFDRLAVDLANNLSPHEEKIIARARPDLDWLSSQGLLTTLSGLISSQGSDIDKQDAAMEGSFLLPGNISRDFERFKKTFRVYNGLRDLRSIASQLRTLQGLDAVAVGLPGTPVEGDQDADRDTVIRITLEHFPTPSDTTPWENILDFKGDEQCMAQFPRLKKWMNKLSRDGLKAYEVKDELAGLITDYERHMKLATMKTQDGILEVILTTTAEIAESVARLKFTGVVKAFFKVKKQAIKLLEEEMKAEGREIAYIVHAKKQFGK